MGRKEGKRRENVKIDLKDREKKESREKDKKWGGGRSLATRSSNCA
jgi:hypothetical protein